MEYRFEHYKESADFIRSKLGEFVPEVAMVLGSGLGYLGDEVENAVTRLNSSTVEVAGDENIYDFFDEIDCPTRNFESDFNTVAGWATEQLERIPEEGDSFVWQNLKVTVTEMDETRILRLRVEKLEAQQEDQD